MDIVVKPFAPHLLAEREQRNARKIAYYTDGRRRIVQIGEAVFVLVSDQTDMQEEAKALMDRVNSSPPDMQCFVMDDGCPQVMMEGAVCAVSTEPLPPGTDNVPFETALPMRETIRAACQKQEIFALIYPDKQ